MCLVHRDACTSRSRALLSVCGRRILLSCLTEFRSTVHNFRMFGSPFSGVPPNLTCSNGLVTCPVPSLYESSHALDATFPADGSCLACCMLCTRTAVFGDSYCVRRVLLSKILSSFALYASFTMAVAGAAACVTLRVPPQLANTYSPNTAFMHNARAQ